MFLASNDSQRKAHHHSFFFFTATTTTMHADDDERVDADVDHIGSSPTNVLSQREHHEFNFRTSQSDDTLSGPGSHAHSHPMPQPSSEYAISPRVSTVGTDDSHHGARDKHFSQMAPSVHLAVRVVVVVSSFLAVNVPWEGPALGASGLPPLHPSLAGSLALTLPPPPPASLPGLLCPRPRQSALGGRPAAAGGL